MLAKRPVRSRVLRVLRSTAPNHQLRILPQTYRDHINPPLYQNFSSTRFQNSSHSESRQKIDDATDSLLSKAVESAATTLSSILVLGVAFAASGYVYHKAYKYMQFRKMDNAFKPGDPVLDMAAVGREIPEPSPEHWIQRDEQPKIDAIINGSEPGRYYLITGDKGCGKSSMLLDAMSKINGEGCAMFEAHSDLELFRIRLGKALDYEFFEDYIGGYFSERGPRDTTALLDIERAFNKLEKVALRHRQKMGRPLILIINQMQLIRDNEDGNDLLKLLQQRAEQWAATNIVTMIFNTDDFWILERFKTLATRMEVISVTDLPKQQALAALRRYRFGHFNETPSKEILETIYDRVGGRLSFLHQVAKSRDMLAMCDTIMEVEKTWLLNQCWILGTEMDDDVMDQQKWASAAMVLAQALVNKEGDMEKTYDPETGHVLPSFALHKAQQIMTRCDFIRELDRLNIFTITSESQVRASSVPMHRAFREICAQPGFSQFLEDTLERISNIESLGRTRELVAKDLVLGGTYEISKAADRSGKLQLTLKQKEEEEEGNDKN
ncbi:hypothetical protein GGS21DRAFT_164734 [Xylaria nigripes]|nr:hypothetical protein GGS21DRAFT_164734 [Xylaria nigripes]